MKLEFLVSEPWDFEGGDIPMITLRSFDDNSDDETWDVWIVSGWDPPSSSKPAVLRPRYQGGSFSGIQKYETIFANLTRSDLKGENTDRKMVSGSVRRI